MGMFNSGKGLSSMREGIGSVIGENAKFKGEFTTAGSVNIDGEFEGIIKAMDGTRNFLGQKHTMKHLKTELNLTKLAERNTWETWERNERKGIAEHAADEAERILREHQVPPLEAQQEKELDEIMAAATKEVVKKK